MDIKKRQKLIGKKFKHPEFKEVEVIGLVERSHTKVEVRVSDQGKGRTLATYPNKVKSGEVIGSTLVWSEGKNREFGHEDIVRIDSLGDEIQTEEQCL